MELFMPSKRIVSAISTSEPLCNWEIYRRVTNKERAEKLERIFAASLVSRITNNYGFNLEDRRIDGSAIWAVAGEGLRNCLLHGPKENNVLFGLFLGDLGVCYSFQDGGSYFKREDIKYQYKNKIPITQTNLAGRDPKKIHGVGINQFMFPFSDIIEVDTKRGILYCAQFKGRIVSQ